MSNKDLLTPHFAVQEFTECATAQKYGIANEPPPEAVNNLRTLCEQTLEPLREAIGMPVVITSGYRCKELNDRISHHSHHSQHLNGQAADFYISPSDVSGSKIQDSGEKHLKPVTGESPMKLETPRQRLIQAFRLILTSERIDYDQLILYPSFIHVSYVNPSQNRHYIMLADSNGRYRRINREAALQIT